MFVILDKSLMLVVAVIHVKPPICRASIDFSSLCAGHPRGSDKEDSIATRDCMSADAVYEESQHGLTLPYTTVSGRGTYERSG